MNDTSGVRRHFIPRIPEGWVDQVERIQKVGSRSNTRSGRQDKTYSYFQRDEVTSAVQKSVRRCLPEETIQWLMELFWMGGSASKTNAWNRLLVMSVEDVSPSNPLLIINVWRLYQDHGDNALAMATSGKILAEASKSRVNDWACHMVRELETSSIVDSIGLPEYFKTKLKRGLAERDIGACIYYVKSLIHSSHKIKKRRYKNSAYLIHEAFTEEYPEGGSSSSDNSSNKYVETLLKITLTPSWRWKGKSILIYINLIHLHCDGSIPCNDDVNNILTKAPVIDYSLEDVVRKYKRREGLVGIPDYAIDKHTKRGREFGRDFYHFIEHGSLITNTDNKWEILSKWYLLQILNDM